MAINPISGSFLGNFGLLCPIIFEVNHGHLRDSKEQYGENQDCPD